MDPDDVNRIVLRAKDSMTEFANRRTPEAAEKCWRTEREALLAMDDVGVYGYMMLRECVTLIEEGMKDLHCPRPSWLSPARVQGISRLQYQAANAILGSRLGARPSLAPDSAPVPKFPYPVTRTSTPSSSMPYWLRKEMEREGDTDLPPLSP